MRSIVQATLTVVCLVGANALGYLLRFADEHLTTLWPPTGVALGLMLASPDRYRRAGVAVLFVVVELGFVAAAGTADRWGWVLFFAVVTAAEVLTAAEVVTRLVPRPFDFAHIPDVLRLTAVCLLVPIPFAAVGAAGLCHLRSNLVPVAEWQKFWFGDALGLAVFGPLCLAWATPAGRLSPPMVPGRWWEAVALIAGLVAVAVAVFGRDAGPGRSALDLPHVVFAFLVWAALRFGPQIATLAVALFGLLMILEAVSGAGPYSPAGGAGVKNHHVLAIQTCLLKTAAVTLVLSAYVLGRRRAALALRESFQHLEAAQKMETAGQLAGGMAHDINNVMTVIRGYAELIEDEAVRLTPDGRTGVKEIGQAVDTATGITRAMLNFLRRHQAEPRALDLSEVLADTAGLIRRSVPSQVELRLEIVPDPVPWVRADKAQLQQVVLNLALNARDAMPGGGVLCVGVGPPRAGACEVTVSDTGTGIPAALANSVFEPLFTTKPAGQGTGLGLPVAKRIVEDLGGTIGFADRPGGGTVFTVRLPCVPPGGYAK